MTHTAETTARPSLFMRDDTFFGVCEGLGEDLGISGNWFRVAFALALFFNPVLTVAAYFGLGLLVIATRMFVRAPRRNAADAVEVDVAEATVARDEDDDSLPLAA